MTPDARWLTADLDVLHLRPHRDDDLAALVAEADDPGVSALMVSIPHPFTEQAGRDYLRRAVAGLADGDDLTYAVTTPDDVLIGGVGLHLGRGPKAGVVQLGFWLGRSHWGKGLMSRAVPPVLAHAFGPLGLFKVEAAAFTSNAQACRILEKNGFRLEGMRRAAILHRGVRHDLMEYGLLAAEHVIDV
jgi:RimJ/RimL family protein N-acetyltransferase